MDKKKIFFMKSFNDKKWNKGPVFLYRWRAPAFQEGGINRKVVSREVCMPVLPVNRNQAKRVRLDKYKRCGNHQVIEMTVDGHLVNDGSFMGKAAGCLVLVVGKKIMEISPGCSTDQKNQEQETRQQLLYVSFCVHNCLRGSKIIFSCMN
jgi:hypothetical protein